MKKQLTDDYLKMIEWLKDNDVDMIADQFFMAINYMNEQDLWEQEKESFRTMTHKLDLIRKEKLQDVFPEVQGLFE
ncbi:hypothetical protein EB151_09670 [archaeon]|nr:hypothetical protein [archaeon]